MLWFTYEKNNILALHFDTQVHENWRNRLEPTCTSSQTLDAYCEQVIICTQIALSCVEEHRDKRPSIVDIIDILYATESMIEEVILTFFINKKLVTR